MITLCSSRSHLSEVSSSPQEKFSSLNAAFDHSIAHRAKVLHLLTQTAPLNGPRQPIAQGLWRK